MPACVLRAGLISLLATVIAPALSYAADAPPLQFQIQEGRVLNVFYQQGPIAAHLLLSNGLQPRVLVAFPAGNSGVGVWFDAKTPVEWKLKSVTPANRRDQKRRALHGIVAEVSASSALALRDAVLGSVRVLRDYQLEDRYPADVKATPKVSGDSIKWSRTRLDGAATYALSIEVQHGVVRHDADKTTLAPTRAGQPMNLRVTALTGEKPLTPLAATGLLNSNATDDGRSRDALGFLSYQEKFLAGSWRFNTYFGRDTLMSLRLLMPVLQPQAFERGLDSVLDRLAPNGEVAHEEDIGEFAILRRRQEGKPASDAPIYDYKMIDDDYMLAPVAAAYLVDQPQGRARAADFLKSSLASGEPVGRAFVRNFTWVVESARAFAEQPQASHLISLKPGSNVGEWRDSETGLGGGRYPYDVNAVLVPAALEAIARMTAARLLDPYANDQQKQSLAAARSFANVWSHKAPRLFQVRIPEAEAKQKVEIYAREIGVPAEAAVEALPSGDLVMNAIALDAHHQPIPVLNSDGGFALLFENLPAAELNQIVGNAMRPFPAGLLTDAGLVVANPVFASDPLKRAFDRNAYHGTVIWSWQQALFAAGLERQLTRGDLPDDTMNRLRSAQRKLWSVIENTRESRSSELWTWRFENGRYQAAPFGQTSGDADESNAAQLWSTVYLAISKPE